MKFYAINKNDVKLSTKAVPIQSSWSKSIRKVADLLGSAARMSKITEAFVGFPIGTFVIFSDDSENAYIEDWYQTHRDGEKLLYKKFMATLMEV